MVYVEMIHDENERLINKSKNQQSDLEITLALSLEKLVDKLDDITEFSMRDLVPLSMLHHHKYIKPHIEYLEKNKKHLKRKHAKELLQVVKDIASMIHIGNYINYDDNNQQKHFPRR